MWRRELRKVKAPKLQNGQDVFQFEVEQK